MIEPAMDRAAVVVSQLMEWEELELEWAGEGNMNYCFVARSADSQPVFVKLFAARLQGRPGMRPIERRYGMERRVLEGCDAHGIPVPTLLASSESARLVVQQFLDARDLGEFLVSGGDIESALTSIGLWLSLFHDVFPAGGSEWSIEPIVGRVARSIERIGLSMPQRLVERLSRIEPGLVLCRNDCHVGNFLVGRDGLVGVDFEMCAPGPPSLELASAFVHSLATAASLDPEKLSIDVMKNLSSRTVDAYNELRPLDHAEFEMFVSLALFRLAGRWPRRARTFSDLARRWERVS